MKWLRRPTNRTLLVRRGVLFIVGGAIINVTVAWGFSVYAQEKPRIQFGGVKIKNSGAGILLKNYSCVGLERVHWNDWGDRPTVPNASFRVVAEPPQWCWLPHTPAFLLRESNNDLRGRWLECAAGWPLLSMRWCLTDRARNYSGEYPRPKLHYVRLAVPGIVYRKLPSDGIDSSDHAILPVLPIWPAFGINTIFYAVVLWGVRLLFTTPGFVRRRIRIMRRQCPACAYPVGASAVCTECGTKLPSPSR